MYFAVFSGIEPDKSPNVTLKVFLDDGSGNHVNVPVTQETTCQEVALCVQHPGYETAHLTYVYKGQDQLLDGRENLYKLLQQWGKQKDEILFFLRRGPQPPSIPPPPPQPPEYYLRRTIIPENYPDQERGIPYQNYPDDGRIHLQEKYQEEERAFPEKYIDVDPTVLRRSIVHTPPPFEQDSFIHYPALDTDEGHLNVFHSNNPNEFQERNQPLAEVYHGTWAEEHNGILQDYPDQGITIATAKPVAVVPTPDLVPTDTQEGENYYYKEESSDTDYIVPSVGDVSSVNPESNGVVEDEEEDAGGYGSNENLDPCIGENVSEDGVLEEDEESGRRGHQRNGMREVPPPPRDLTPARTNGLPGGVDLTLTELQDMASRQQQQIESQQQVLVAKEQRLKYLKQQEQRQQQVAAENDRLRKLREKVESQEMKLKKLRALRGEVEKHQMSNGTLNTELESVKALFTEKEKELVMAVAKVEELTRQLEQIRQERANVKNGSQSSAAHELEKLRKELMIRNKVNEQQNAKLNVHKEMLNQRKGEVANMDNRIHELQQRLKKKRAQQAENVKNGGNKKNDSNRNSNRPSKVAAVEPYIQYKPAKESVEQDLKSGFHKQDPNYQSLPPNLKFPQQENSRVEDTKGLKEQNNNSEKQNLTKPGSVTDNSKCISNGSLVNQVSDSIIRAAQRHQVVPGGATVRGPSNSGKPPPPPLPVRSATTGLTHLTPRPFGSTYSTTVLGNNKGHNQSSQQNPNVNGPSINVQEDVRQGGSGQSSPASSDSSLKENTFPSENMKHLPNVPNSAPPRPNLRRKLPSPEPNMSSGRPNQSHDQVDATRPLHSNSNTKSQKSVTNSAAAFTEQNGANGNVNTNTSAKGASSKQIANLYMGRLGKGGSQKFQDSLNILYKNASDEKSSNVEGKERIIDNSVKSATNQRVPSPDTSPSAIPPPSPPKSSHHQTFTPPGSPNYPDIASDKASHNRHGHTPKGIRRRHSDSDNEDTQNIAKLMHKHNLDRHNIHHSQNNAYSDRPALLAETQATSFIGGIPENVPVDSLGNLVEISDNNESGQNDNSSSSNSSNVVVSPVSTDIKVTGGAVKGKKTNLRRANSKGSGNRVSFDPLALLLDASLEGELELVKRCASQVQNVSESNDEGITALHNAICAGHYDIVTFLVEFGCDVNSPDSDGWTPLHCAASCNNLPMVIFLVEHGACIFATTISDHETAAEKCEEDEDGYDGCSEYLYSVQEKLGILNGGVVYAVFDYEAQNPDELGFSIGDEITVLKKGDESEKEWWWSKSNNKEGYIPRNLLGLYPRVLPHDYTPEC